MPFSSLGRFSTIYLKLTQYIPITLNDVFCVDSYGYSIIKSMSLRNL